MPDDVTDAERADLLARMAEQHRQWADEWLDSLEGPTAQKMVESHSAVASEIEEVLATEDPGAIVALADQMGSLVDEWLERWCEKMSADERADFDRRLAEAKGES